ncbi:hypothetical protein ACHWQZ_G019555 [Mnemiopsis leidyi]
MGVGSSSRLQKQLFPRSKTKFEALQDKLTGNNQSYPSVPASSQQIQVDPEYTPQYSDLLKNVAGNIKSANHNFKFKEFSMNTPTETKVSKTPRGYLDRDMLTTLFVTDKTASDLPERFGMTSEELDRIFSCYTGYKIHKNVGDEPSEFVKEILQERNEPPHRVVNTAQFTSQILSDMEKNRLKEDARSDGTLDLESSSGEGGKRS